MPAVPKVRTPATADQVRQALIEAWQRARIETPSANIQALMLAQTALETARWQSMFNNNLANMIATNSDQEFFHALDSGNERIFRSFETLETGAERYVRQMLSDTRPNWRDGLLTGDPERFNAGLSTPPRFYEADPAKYGAALTQLFFEFGGAEVPQDDPKHGAGRSWPDWLSSQAPITYSDAPPMPELRAGHKGPAVAALQSLLKHAGADPGPIDGYFGPATLGGLVGFQVRSLVSAEVEGRTDRRTWVLLASAADR